MKKTQNLLPILMFLACLGWNCSPPSPKTSEPNSGTLLLQPLGDFPAAESDSLKAMLGKVYAEVQVLEAVEFPKRAWYAPRNRYRADSLLKYFQPEVPKGSTKLLLSTKDISATKEPYPDFGIMGLALISGNIGIISSFRLHKAKKMEQLKKLALHELGHTAGLNHCPESSCILHDAEGKNRFDMENGLCEQCTNFLRSAGWRI